MIAILFLTLQCLAVALALIAVSRYIADRWERRRNAYYEQLTTFQQAMERIIREEQPR